MACQQSIWLGRTNICVCALFLLGCRDSNKTDSTRSGKSQLWSLQLSQFNSLFPLLAAWPKPDNWSKLATAHESSKHSVWWNGAGTKRHSRAGWSSCQNAMLAHLLRPWYVKTGPIVYHPWDPIQLGRENTGAWYGIALEDDPGHWYCRMSIWKRFVPGRAPWRNCTSLPFPELWRISEILDYATVSSACKIPHTPESYSVAAWYDSVLWISAMQPVLSFWYVKPLYPW